MPDTRPPAGYVHVGTPDRQIAKTIECGDGTQVDVDADGRVVGVETIGHTDFTRAAFAALRNLRVAGGSDA